MVYDFSPSRAGEHARNFLGDWNGKLVCDDFAGYKVGFEQGITEIGCMAHARRKFFDLNVANKSQLAEQAPHSISGLYEVERRARDMSDEDRWRIRQEGLGQHDIHEMPMCIQLRCIAAAPNVAHLSTESLLLLSALEPQPGRLTHLARHCLRPDESLLMDARTLRFPAFLGLAELQDKIYLPPCCHTYSDPHA